MEYKRFFLNINNGGNYYFILTTNFGCKITPFYYNS